jgi:RHH-type proline utilization regulon transcriptional repressor/proline dehydrogenase/delta 1-pyrroline-5-carboxylate dehydrogenase
VIFTGSTEVARLIQAQLAGRLSPTGKPVPLIAETGGANAMIVDSSALAEQVVADVIASAFDSAGQRCSALRLLCLQEDVADRIMAMLEGALAELAVGRTDRLAVDVGPVIDAEAAAAIERHVAAMRALGRPVHRLPLGAEMAHGTFVAPTIVALDKVSDLPGEIFGPVLHVVRYRRDAIDSLIEEINATGYGLTFGLHSRLDETIAHVTSRIEAGNLYVNRNMIGAVVGVQPFGGRGFSGTGPKAGGPLYLERLAADPSDEPVGGQRISPAHGDQPPALLDYAAWLEAKGEGEAAAKARAYGSASPVAYSTELPGPVGERNLYALEPRGPILLRPETVQGLFDQLGAVLATGNRAMIDAPPSLMQALRDAPGSIRAHLVDYSSEAVAGALVEGAPDRVIASLRAIAGRSGPLVLTQAASPERCATGRAYRLEWLCEEVTTSINTTAAGGNASLMTIA